jgi:hypothetical protein
MINNYKYYRFLYTHMNGMLRHDSACPLCQGKERQSIKRIDGTLGLYCPACKFIENIAYPLDLELPGGAPK